MRSLNKTVPRGTNSKCKGTEIETSLERLRNRKKASVVLRWREEGEVWKIILNRYARTRCVEYYVSWYGVCILF